MIKLLSLATAGLLLVLAAPWAVALEMGELVTRSRLGQPYVGEIRIQGEAYSQISPDCVRLVKPLGTDNLPDLPPGTRIEYVSSPQGELLRLIGRQKVLDPALQISVFIGCGANLQRDYVVMLDLPSQAEPVSEPASRPAATKPKAQPASLPRPRQHTSTQPPRATAPQSATTPRASAPGKAAEAPRVEPPPAAPPVAVRQPAATPAEAPATQAPQPAAAAMDNDPLITAGLISLIALLLLGIWYQHRRNILEAAREDYAPGGHPFTQLALTLPRRPDDAPSTAEARSGVGTTPPAQAKSAEDDEMPILPATPSSEYMMDLTDVMLSFGETQRALKVLHEFVHDHPDEAVAPWLRLLELLRLHGKRDEFHALAIKLHQVFNVVTPTWDEADKAAPAMDALKRATSLEDFTHIRQRLVETWGTPEGIKYLDILVRDNRASQRRGFPLEIAEEAILLRDVLAVRLNET